MGDKLLFLRHAETVLDPSKDISKWDLTEEGRSNAEELAKDERFDSIDVVVSSSEPKAYQTARPFASRFGEEIVQYEGLREIDRDEGGVLDKEEYERVKKSIFQDLDHTEYGWESARDALNRYKQTVEEIREEYDGEILIVSHGTVMNLYFAYKQEKMDGDELIRRWKEQDFLSYGEIKDGSVVEDIV